MLNLLEENHLEHFTLSFLVAGLLQVYSERGEGGGGKGGGEEVEEKRRQKKGEKEEKKGSRKSKSLRNKLSSGTVGAVQ